MNKFTRSLLAGLLEQENNVKAANEPIAKVFVKAITPPLEAE